MIRMRIIEGVGFKVAGMSRGRFRDIAEEDRENRKLLGVLRSRDGRIGSCWEFCVLLGAFCLRERRFWRSRPPSISRWRSKLPSISEKCQAGRRRLWFLRLAVVELRWLSEGSAWIKDCRCRPLRNPSAAFAPPAASLMFLVGKSDGAAQGRGRLPL